MKLYSLVVGTAMTLSGAAFAQTSTADHSAHHPPAASAAAAATATSEGEVRKVDKEQGKVTLKHGPIANLDMPGMTMIFKVADPKMLDNLKPGDKVKFAASNKDGAITVTAIEVAR
ncbi:MULTISPECIES: copper-binding protein [unclassified Methylibium]|jgi:Cu(I)/Ag(I) efflux system periplasmic protein CusF|uniref:copper-binding protein n=1 Tax=unclassified Methylibium TaxID=2633235 RepID=UPI0003F4318A|nr:MULTISPECIES: copper-binding protein [unclassified Methylibium]EWS55976.1 Cation efflux system protein CusF precursor [Methylibium sp. T29]EWS62071.1 Cation efflux system protein CusF precursor [Methylibium sp. T29-B]MBL8360039.1 copper-binding protein [Rubrivivax sp.]